MLSWSLKNLRRLASFWDRQRGKLLPAFEAWTGLAGPYRGQTHGLDGWKRSGSSRASVFKGCMPWRPWLCERWAFGTSLELCKSCLWSSFVSAGMSRSSRYHFLPRCASQAASAHTLWPAELLLQLRLASSFPSWCPLQGRSRIQGSPSSSLPPRCQIHSPQLGFLVGTRAERGCLRLVSQPALSAVALPGSAGLSAGCRVHPVWPRGCAQPLSSFHGLRNPNEAHAVGVGKGSRAF